MNRDRGIAAIMGVIALGLVLGALGFQFLAHLAPCEMCHWQRWPHIAAAFLGLAGIQIWKKHAYAGMIATIAVVAIAGVAITGQWKMAPYIAAGTVLICTLLTLVPAPRAIVAATVALVAVSGLIGAYQTGMQIGILPGPSACVVKHAYVLGSGAPPPEVSCDAVTWSLFGLSLAAYNAILSLGAAALGAIFLVKKT